MECLHTLDQHRTHLSHFVSEVGLRLAEVHVGLVDGVSKSHQQLLRCDNSGFLGLESLDWLADRIAVFLDDGAEEGDIRYSRREVVELSVDDFDVFVETNELSHILGLGAELVAV